MLTPPRRRWFMSWSNPGYTRGRLNFLMGRDADPVSTRSPDIDAKIAEKTLDVICKSFSVPRSQRYCLRPEDKLLDLYNSMYPDSWPDCLDFNWLQCLIERSVSRQVPLANLKDLSVDALMRLLAASDDQIVR